MLCFKSETCCMRLFQRQFDLMTNRSSSAAQYGTIDPCSRYKNLHAVGYMCDVGLAGPADIQQQVLWCQQHLERGSIFCFRRQCAASSLPCSWCSALLFTDLDCVGKKGGSSL